MARLVVIALKRSYAYHWLLANAIERLSPVFVKKWQADHNPMKAKHVTGRGSIGVVVVGHHALSLLHRCGVKPQDFPKSVYVAAAEPMSRNRNLRACQGFDVVISCQNDKAGLEAFRQVNPTARVIGSHLCAEETVFRPYPEPEKFDIGMVGTFRKADRKGRRSSYYWARKEWMDKLEAEGFSVLLRQGLYMENYARALCRCRIGFHHSNRGWRKMKHYPPAMRIFETMAIGRMLLCDTFDLNGLRLKEGVHYVTFPPRDYKAMREKVRYYLAHPEERETIALNGRAFVLKRHTYRHRAALILEQFGLSPKG